MIITNYKKENGNKGAMIKNINGEEIAFIAVTAVSSKEYKSLKGAEKCMTKFGYVVA